MAVPIFKADDAALLEGRDTSSGDGEEIKASLRPETQAVERLAAHEAAADQGCQQEKWSQEAQKLVARQLKREGVAIVAKAGKRKVADLDEQLASVR